MGNSFGNKIKYTIFGESHGNAIGIVIDGLPSGIKLDINFIKEEMARRAPGRNEMSTSRKEGDSFEILSGYFEGRTTGTPLCSIIYNSDQHSKDYEKIKYVMRPGHADYTGYVRYSGFNDYRGGGHFSGRITAPLVFAGAVAKIILKEKGIEVGSHVLSIKNVKDKYFDKVNVNKEMIMNLRKKYIPTIDEDAEIKMKDAILNAKKEKDSVGGIIEAAIINVPTGLGDPFFDSVESNISHIIFSVPAVKGIEFGTGFDITNMMGSEANDDYYYDNGKVKTYTNNNGGILGGITNGMPIIFRAALKPTPSIGKKQRTIDIKDKKDTYIEVTGRHDPCIVLRAVPVIEAAASIAILDFL